MFFVGIFSTHIPFVILAVIYLVLFPIYALRKRESVGISIPSKPEAAKVQFVSTERQNRSASVYYYESHYIKRIKIASSKSLLFQLFDTFITVKIPHPLPLKYTSEMWKHQLFSRPPPAL